MKENLIKLIDELFKRKEFENGKLSLTLNYENIIIGYKKNNVNKETYDLAIEKINSTDVKNFNVTIQIERGIDHSSIMYSDDWKSVNYTFYGKDGVVDEDDEDDEGNKYLSFEFNTLGSRESFRVSEKLRKFTLTDKYGDPDTIEGNHFDFDTVDKTIDLMIQLDQLLDKQMEEKNVLFNKLRKEL